MRVTTVLKSLTRAMMCVGRKQIFTTMRAKSSSSRVPLKTPHCHEYQRKKNWSNPWDVGQALPDRIFPVIMHCVSAPSYDCLNNNSDLCSLVCYILYIISCSWGNVKGMLLWVAHQISLILCLCGSIRFIPYYVYCPCFSIGLNERTSDHNGIVGIAGRVWLLFPMLHQ